MCEPAWTREAKELPARGPGECVLLEVCLDQPASRLVRSDHKHIWHEPALGFAAHVRCGVAHQNVALSNSGAQISTVAVFGVLKSQSLVRRGHC